MSRTESDSQLTLDKLSSFDIFQGLTEEQIKKFAGKFKALDFAKGDVIIQEGDQGNSLLLLYKGDVEISVALTLKTDTLHVDTREKSLIKLSESQHPFFGEMSLFNDNDKRTATVTAKTECVVARISRDDFFNICNKNPEVGNQVMQNIARVLCVRLNQANNNVLKLTTAFSLIVEN